MCYSVPYHEGFARGMRDTITIDTECTKKKKILVNPTINPANAIETGSEKTEQP